MLYFRIVAFCAILSICWCAEDWSFPKGFKFGSATAAYQCEGAWNVSDKGESIWDRFVHNNPTATRDQGNGDVACDSYHQWQRDIEMAKELGLHYYRFSISWPRLLPKGYANYISEDGKEYYNRFINALLAEGIEPLVTLYHWDLPQSLQDLGGWTNPLVVDWFGDYARVVYSLFADRVKIWITINEPTAICDGSYSVGIMAPGYKGSEHGTYLCNKHVLLAHARAYRIFDEEFRPKYEGELSLANALTWYEPWTEDDLEIAELARQFGTGRYTHAIYSKEGGWPPSIEKIMEEDSKKKGYSQSILPAFTQEEIEYIRGTYDFFGMNHYTTRLVRKAKEGEQAMSGIDSDLPEINAILGVQPEWEVGAAEFSVVFAPGIRRQLLWLKESYGDLNIIITENGYSTFSGLNDIDRINYYDSYLRQVLLAIKEDGVNVTRYTAWSMMDVFEWGYGYRVGFGLYEVNFQDSNRTRTPRASAKYYANVIKSNSLDVPIPRLGNV